MSKKVLFVLGAYSAEVAMVKRLLAAVGLPYTAATKGGEMVKTVANAFAADGMSKAPEAGQQVAFVECRVSGYEPIKVFESLSRNPNEDLGSPEFYMGSSAIGQLVSSLISHPVFGGGREAAEKLEPLLWEARLAAASEHYLSDAYRGRCPGVNPSALRLWRAMNRAELMEKKPRDVLAMVDAAVDELQKLPSLALGGGRSVIRVDKYIPEMYEAAAITGLELMYSRKEKEGGKTKVTLINASAQTIEAWVEWASTPGSGLEGAYGSPSKGYAGAFLS